MDVNKFLLCFGLSLVCCSEVLAKHDFVELNNKIDNSMYEAKQWKNLLHYDGEKSVVNKGSTFFLDKHGNKNLKKEFEMSVFAMLDIDELGDEHFICMYPARFEYIVSVLELDKAKLPKPKCIKLDEYRRKVPIDTVKIVFASENNSSPTSIMGHTFLKLIGVGDGIVKEHAFSYFAALDEANSISFYYNILVDGINGAYILSPYNLKKDEYLWGDNRSIWEFEIDLSEEEKWLLKNHFWELKEHFITYSLLSHNCNTAVIQTLKIANDNFDANSFKPFVTPVEYVQKLNERKKIKAVSLEPSSYVQKRMDDGVWGNIFEANKSTRLSVGYGYLGDEYLTIEFMPVYKDIRDVSNAYVDESESKLFSFDMKYNLNKNKLFVDKVDILKIRSIIDYSKNKDFSKHFKLSLENALDKNTTAIRPMTEFGLGFGWYNQYLSTYIIPKVGYRYDQINNIYIAPEVGVIARPTYDSKIMFSYEYYFDSKNNNRGYDSILNLRLGYMAWKGIDIYIDYKKYTDATDKNEVDIGLVYSF